MPTNRKVIDFKIHNLTEEQFQELKEAGQIDPNAIYCTPDETVANFEAVNARIDETNKKLNTFESGVNETVGVINTTIVNVDKKVDEVIQTEQQHNIEINARIDETDDKLDKKVSVVQGEENAGKVLVVNEDGEVVPDKPKVGASLPILTHVFADHKLNDISWLNADTFSWQSGDVYVAAYEHLVNDIAVSDDGYITTENGVVFNRDSSKDKDGLIAWTSIDSTTVYTSNPPIIGESPSAWDDNRQIWGVYSSTISSGSNVAYQERISNITITFYHTEDGHKICLPDQEANVQSLYEKTGIAWYYILDTENKQFKLPRTKFGFTGLRDSVGGYVEAGLPNITGTLGSGYGGFLTDSIGQTGALYATNSSGTGNLTGSVQTRYNLGFDASRSNSIYGNSTTVQPKATQMYLYFYVGNFEREAVEQTAGITSEQLNNKADIELFNAIYPVGSIYIGTQSVCPMAIAIPNSTWELLEAGRALWTGNGSNGNTKIAAGLPNITATFAQYTPNVGDLPVATTTGAAYGTRNASVKTYSAQIIDAGSGNTQVAFDARRSSSIYGNSTTVQPPAYVVNVWRRTA